MEKDDFQSSIPLATISIEESLKGLELVTRFKHNEDLTNQNWIALQNHKHKLTHVMSESLEILKNATEEDLEKAKGELEKLGIGVSELDLSKPTTSLQNRVGVISNFQKLRESCFYVDWDKLRGKWMLFDELSKDSQEKLAFYVNSEAKIIINNFKIGIERYVNRLRETGQLLEKLPYPSYIEHRTSENFESNVLLNSFEKKIDKIKYEQGLKIMKQFIEQESFEFLIFGYF